MQQCVLGADCLTKNGYVFDLQEGQLFIGKDAILLQAPIKSTQGEATHYVALLKDTVTPSSTTCADTGEKSHGV